MLISKEWICATATRNYMLKDAVCDYFKIRHERTKTNSSTFPLGMTYLMKQGIIFESNVLTSLKSVLQNHEYVEIPEGNKFTRARNTTTFQLTCQAIERRVPVILSGVLHNVENKTYGLPDIIVRNDYIPKLFDTSHLHTSTAFNNDEYSIIDVKFMTLPMSTNGTFILNTSSIPAYKSQLWVYTSALHSVTKKGNMKAYILGRRSCIRGEKRKRDNDAPVSRYTLGEIDFNGKDARFKCLTDKALQWIRDLRANWKTWDLTSCPLPRPELYPNMSNTHDAPFHEEKEELAQRIGEITMLYMCGIKNRELAHSRGVYSLYTATPESLGFGVSTKTYTPLKRMIETEVTKSFVKPNATFVKYDNEFYIDFETTADICATENVPQIVFMIGVAKLNGVYPGTNVLNIETKVFYAKSLTYDEENRIFNEFIMYINQNVTSQKNPPVMYHWSHIEKTKWNDVIKNKLRTTRQTSSYKFIDMCKMFKETPIVIPGCLNFKLKNVAKRMKEMGYITRGYDTTKCADGLSAVVMLLTCVGKMNFAMCMKDIEEYNKTDVIVLCEIMNFLRT